MKIVAGIDPGLNGAIAILNEDGRLVDCHPCPVFKNKGKRSFFTAKMARDFRDILTSDLEGEANISVYLEKAQAMPKQGVSSTFKTGMGFGLWKGIIQALQIPLFIVTPQAWQKRILRGVSGNTKERSAIVAVRLFPEETFIPEGCRKIHDGMTDAACIARYGWLEEMGGDAK